MQKYLTPAIYSIPLLAALVAESLFPDHQWSATLWFPEIAIAIVGVITILKDARCNWQLRATDVAILFLIGWCVTVDFHKHTLSAYRLLYWGAMWVYFMLVRESKNAKEFAPYVIVSLTMLCAISEIGNHLFDWERQFFNNEAGYATALSIGFPFLICRVLKNWRDRSILQNFFGLASCTLTGYSIILTNSRSSWLALLLAGIVCALIKCRKAIATCKRFMLLVLLSFLIICGCALSLYNIRPASADGRILIYNVAVQCVEQAPLTGHGSMGILRDYMPAQGKFLAKNTEHSSANLANNVPYVFNEILGMSLKYGIVGLALFTIAIIAYLKDIRESGMSLAMISICIIMAVMSMFSYPSAWPYVNFLLLFVAGTEIQNIPHKGIRYARIPVLLAFFFTATILLPIRICAEATWRKGFVLAEKGNTVKGLHLYSKSLATLNNQPEFIYNYAAELNAAGHFDESLEQMKRCTNLLNDSDTELLIADNYMALHQWEKAIPHLQNASDMVPCRFMPIYGLMQVYDAIGNRQKANTYATIILRKPVKIPSPEVDDIKDAAYITLKAYSK